MERCQKGQTAEVEVGSYFDLYALATPILLPGWKSLVLAQSTYFLRLEMRGITPTLFIRVALTQNTEDGEGLIKQIQQNFVNWQDPD